jgi:hypothetical protein
MRKAADLAGAMEAIAAALARGAPAPREAARLARLIETFLKAIEAGAFDRRLRVSEGAGARSAHGLRYMSACSALPRPHPHPPPPGL